MVKPTKSNESGFQTPPTDSSQWSERIGDKPLPQIAVSGQKESGFQTPPTDELIGTTA